jgi:polyhydroxyalkanoate synthesis regulator phasin
MAKNVDQDGPDGTGGAKSRAEQLRGAVEGAFGAASRVRDVLEDLRPPSPEEFDGLRAQVDALERRVAELEGAAAAAKHKSKPKRS